MKINLTLEWFLNPDHLPFIVGIKQNYYTKRNIELNIIMPNEHYDGFCALKSGEIEMALNEPLHLIEQFDTNMLSLGTFFSTSGGVLLSRAGISKLLDNKPVKISSPVSNNTTNKIAIEILRRYTKEHNIDLQESNITIDEVSFYHIDNIQNSYDGAWLAFYNFEGIQAKLCGMDLVLIDSALGKFPNFCELDIFTTKQFYEQNKQCVKNFTEATKESINFISKNKEYAKKLYYEFSGETCSVLMDAIIDDTIARFDSNFVSCAASQKEILEFFRSLNITSLEYDVFQNAFLKECL